MTCLRVISLIGVIAIANGCASEHKSVACYKKADTPNQRASVKTSFNHSKNEGLSISIQFASADYDIGDKIIATVTFTNATAQEVMVPANVPRFDTEIILTNEKGQRLELKKPANWNQLTDFQKRLSALVRNPKFKTVAPGTEETYRINMTELFDLDAAGKYDVEIHYRLSSDGRCIIDARSNTATFSIATN